jgi:hypothetical protein
MDVQRQFGWPWYSPPQIGVGGHQVSLKSLRATRHCCLLALESAPRSRSDLLRHFPPFWRARVRQKRQQESVQTI